MAAAHRAGKLQLDDLRLGKELVDPVQVAVVDDAPLVDDDRALAQILHIVHVVAGEDDGGFLLLVVIFEELADLICERISSPMVGSSRKINFGLWISAAISSIFMRSPSERRRTCTFSRSFTSSSSVSSARVAW